MAYSSITKPEDYFNIITYTGNNTADHAITGVGFRPEFFWTKSYDQTQSNLLFDFVRGTEKFLKSDSTGAEDTQSGTVTSFDSDGVTFGASSAGNASGYNYVAWNWLAGGTASSNTDGSITSSVSVNTTSGISIGTYTGTSSADTIGHGLSSAPEMIIVKNRSSGTRNWAVYHKNLTGTNKYLRFTGDAEQTDSSTWNNTAPTSSVWSVAASGETNQNTENFVFYAFHSVKGYSKIGTYTGNGSSDGTFIYTGFRPAFTMVKRVDGIGDWIVMDTTRSAFNLTDNRLRPNSTGPQATGGNSIDILSNGFKNRTNDGYNNGAGGTYIYITFAENPLVANVNGGIPATAR